MLHCNNLFRSKKSVTICPNIPFLIRKNTDRKPVHISIQTKCVIIIKYIYKYIKEIYKRIITYISLIYIYSNTSDLYKEIFIFNNENHENVRSVFRSNMAAKLRGVEEYHKNYIYKFIKCAATCGNQKN